MHIPDGALSPQVCAVTAVASVAAVGMALRRLERSESDRVVPLMGMTAAFLFAAQMVNFPLPGTLVSGHLMGGVLAAVLLGPWAGCVALAAVLIVQCLLFGDGGLLSLGANMLHMSVVGSLGGYFVYSAVKRVLGNSRRSILVASVFAAWLSVMASACLFCLEFVFSHGTTEYNVGRMLTLMVSLHSLIGVGEAVITGVVVSFVLQQRPDLIDRTSGEMHSPATGFAIGGIVCALAVGAFLAPFASPHPDGLEAVAEQTQWDEQTTESWWSLLPDYMIPMGAGEKASVAAAGAFGTVAVLLVALALGRAPHLRTSLAEVSRE